MATQTMQELINEYRYHHDKVEELKAKILKRFERNGVKNATATMVNDKGKTLITDVSYRKATNDTLIFDSVAFCADETRAALYDSFRTKQRKGSPATVAIKCKTA